MRISPTRSLALKAKAGCRESFEQLMVLCKARLEALIRLRMGTWLRSHMEVEDAFQETCLEAFRSIHTFQCTGDDSFPKWLGGIAEHVIQNALKKLRAKKRHGGSAAVNGHDPGPEVIRDARLATSAGDSTSPLKALLREERFRRLERALASLSDSHREVIILARVRGLPLQEIAQELGSTPKAVSMMLVRALRKLRAAFGRTESFKLPPWGLDPDASGRQ